ncbi:hypothetical protein [Aquabacterium sp. OR-4]|nr:hypothetical protein [Aquabacterium sp. OR-4]MDT7836445.1 hypothetical protein [Aquabacterium sp. OR-4]
MLTTLTIAATAAAYRGALAWLNNAPAGTRRARAAQLLGGGGPGPK